MSVLDNDTRCVNVAPHGTVSVLVQSVSVQVPEPSWCIADHSGNHFSLDDVSHCSQSVSLSAPLFGGGTTDVLAAAVYQWPFGRDGRAPYLGLDPEGSADVAPLAFGAALAFADQLVAHAERIRAMVNAIGGAA